MSEPGGRHEIASKFFSVSAWKAACGMRVVPLWVHSGDRPKANDECDDRRDGGCAGQDEQGESEPGKMKVTERRGGSDRVDKGGGGRATSDKA